MVPPPAPPAATDSAERRQLTVMFCDLVGSTALASRLDPEDLRELIGRYHACAAEAVGRCGGFVAKYMGDGMLAYFGYPEAHEDDAERAVHAALALVEEVRRLSNSEPLQARIGIGTGLVIVGDLVGSGAAQERGIVGETPNLAARLQAHAAPDAIVIDAQTRQLLGDLFEYADLGTVEVRGFPRPVHAYRVLRSSAVQSRFEAFHAAALTPLVGREEEVDLLRRRWQRAKAGGGEVVLLSGEAGIGKSRVTAVILEQIAGEAHTRLRYFCSPHHTNSALHPIVSQIEHAAGFARDDDAPAKFARLDALLALTATSIEDRRLIADLLSMPDIGRYPALDLTAQQRKQQTLAALLRQIEALARRQPVLIVFEDAHWIDPTSLELLDQAVGRIRRLPVLLLMTFRPEFQSPWVGQAHVTTMALSRLDQREGAALVERIAGGTPLSAEIVTEIVERTDGVPLFVEELTKSVIEAGAGGDRATGALASAPLPRVAVPATLHASLMARLDRLGPAAKEVAQIGAAIGREFSWSLVRAVGARTDADLHAALGRLVESGLAFCRGVPPQASYLFKHALVQDAAYGTLLRKRRQDLHDRIVAVLEERFPEIVDQQPELLAHHCAQAGSIGKAVAYWARAGRQSLARSAMTEAAAQVRKGLELLPQLPDGAETWRLEFDLQKILGAALLASKGNAAPETGQAYARARALCERLGDTEALIPVLGGLSTCHQTRGEFSAMRQISEDLLRIGERRNDTVSTLVGSRSMGLCFYHLGDFVAARRHLDRVLALYTPGLHHSLASVTSFDMRAAALSYLSLISCILGDPGQAASFGADALAYSRNLHNPHNLTFSLNYVAISRLLGRDERAAEELLNELSALAVEHQFPVWIATANILRGHVLAGRGIVEGLALARKGWADRLATGSQWHGSFYLGLLARSCESAGQADEALDMVRAAIGMADRMGERWFQPELYRHKGEWLAAYRKGRQSEAEALFRRALALARGQQAGLWELRAATSLARLWSAQGREAEACDVLAPVHRRLAAGNDSADLRDAAAVLDALRQKGALSPFGS